LHSPPLKLKPLGQTTTTLNTTGSLFSPAPSVARQVTALEP
jgi:hypothetical protein